MKQGTDALHAGNRPGASAHVRLILRYKQKEDSITMTVKTFGSMLEVKQANRARGHHFFDASSMRFFRSRVGDRVYLGVFFISSEQFDWKSPRLYTVRVVNEDGTIDDVSQFQQFSSHAQAARYIGHLVPNASPCANCRRKTYNRNFTCDACKLATSDVIAQ